MQFLSLSSWSVAYCFTHGYTGFQIPPGPLLPCVGGGQPLVCFVP
jgi:hypothetical protein